MTKHTQRLISSCCGGTVHEGEFLAGCAHNWICDTCGSMCQGINAEAVPKVIKALEEAGQYLKAGRPDLAERSILDGVTALAKARETH